MCYLTGSDFASAGHTVSFYIYWHNSQTSYNHGTEYVTNQTFGHLGGWNFGFDSYHQYLHNRYYVHLYL